MRKKKTVLIFGTFDKLHAGHRFFLREARKHGDYLIVAVAPDSAVRQFKGKPPSEPLGTRLANLLGSGLVDKAVPGDSTPGLWTAFRKYAPDTIVLGYDQEKLKNALETLIKKKKFIFTLVRLPAYHPEKYHSSFLQ